MTKHEMFRYHYEDIPVRGPQCRFRVGDANDNHIASFPTEKQARRFLLRHGVSLALYDIHRERLRQVTEEGFSAERDDKHKNAELASAAASYCASAARPTLYQRKPDCAFAVPPLWPRTWNLQKWWKPKNPRADLVKAGALIAAEIDRLDRMERAES